MALTFIFESLSVWTVSDDMVTVDIIQLFVHIARKEPHVPGSFGGMRF